MTVRLSAIQAGLSFTDSSMPFSEDFDLFYGIVKKGLNNAGYVCNRVDEIAGPTPVINKILTEILRSRYIIADLTNCNPNVFYELGVAHAFKDASNIITLKQSGTKVPFDITHLTYIEYDIDNPKYITSAILKSIKQYSYLADFQEGLNLRGIVPYIKDTGDFFVDYLKSELDNSLNLLTQILMNNAALFDEGELSRFLEKYEATLGKCIVEKMRDILPGVLRTYQELLISTSQWNCAQEHTLHFLDGTFLSRFELKPEETLSWQTDLAVALASAKKMFTITLPWIIRYFSHTKTATIDLNRYKLEAFLMTSEHPEVNEMICNAVFDPNCYIREHMSDIIGEKRIFEGLQNLCRQLRGEENFFTAVSIIEALGKLGDPSALTHIQTWINENERKIIQEKQFFVLKHAQISITRLDTAGGHILQEFRKKYEKYLKDYNIL